LFGFDGVVGLGVTEFGGRGIGCGLQFGFGPFHVLFECLSSRSPLLCELEAKGDVVDGECEAMDLFIILGQSALEIADFGGELVPVFHRRGFLMVQSFHRLRELGLALDECTIDLELVAAKGLILELVSYIVCLDLSELNLQRPLTCLRGALGSLVSKPLLQLAL
jgi:hypothetical protein